MKKLLLGTSALIGATAIVASASAAPELTISGNLDFRLVGGDNAALRLGADDNDDGVIDSAERTAAITARNAANADNGVGTNGAGYSFSRAVDSRSEIRFNAKGESDGGITYGADIQYRYQAGSTDESYVFVAGDFGRVHLGNDDGVADSIPYWGSVSAGAYMIDGWETSIGRHGHGTGDETKVSYFSNDLGGFSFGVSLTDGVGNFESVYELMARFGSDFGGGSFGIGLGYKGGSSTNAANEDLGEYILGATASFGDFSIAGAFTDAGESGRPTVTTDTSEARSASGISVAYNLGGGMAISLGLAESETQANGGRQAKNSIAALDFGFPILDGMAGYAGIAKTEREFSGGGAATVSTDATTYLVGTTVSF